MILYSFTALLTKPRCFDFEKRSKRRPEAKSLKASESKEAGKMSLVGPSFLTGLEGSGSVSLAKGGATQDLVWFRFGTNAAVLYDLSELRSRVVLSVPR